jgi:hypothetical protein
MKLSRSFDADRAVRTNVVIVSTPSLAFLPRLVEAQEPVRVQALSSELSVERLDVGIVRRLSRSGEVERHTADEGPQVQLLADELRAVVDTDRFRKPRVCGRALQRRHDVGAPIVLSNVDRRRQPRECVDNRQCADLAAIEKLVVNKVRRGRAGAALAQLRLHAPLLLRNCRPISR